MPFSQLVSQTSVKKYACLSSLSEILLIGPAQGKWSIEDAERLLELHAEKGNRWKEIGAALGRLPETCRDKYRDLALAQARQTGKWTPGEEGRLNELVTSYMEQRPVSPKLCHAIMCGRLLRAL